MWLIWFCLFIQNVVLVHFIPLNIMGHVWPNALKAIMQKMDNVSESCAKMDTISIIINALYAPNTQILFSATILAPTELNWSEKIVTKFVNRQTKYLNLVCASARKDFIKSMVNVEYAPKAQLMMKIPQTVNLSAQLTQSIIKLQKNVLAVKVFI